jgi:hypothetical protein
MFEVYHLPPTDPARESRVAEVVAPHGGRLVFREAPEVDGSPNVCLTYEFASEAAAEAAGAEVRAAGEYAEGPYPYS